MSTSDTSARELATSRVLPFPRDRVFRAIAERERLARWWGPAGFRNTMDTFEFREGGEWRFTMHGPDGKDYPNASRFETIQAPGLVVVRHANAPLFRLFMTLSEEGKGTRMHWRQVFDDARVRDELAAICVPANEQNLDRLEAELSSHP
jgi:uncharacterized protein YndB with AHSA1/START domain